MNTSSKHNNLHTFLDTTATSNAVATLRPKQRTSTPAGMEDYNPRNVVIPAGSNNGIASDLRRSGRTRREPQNMVRDSIPKAQMSQLNQWYANVNVLPPRQNRNKTRTPGDEVFDIIASIGDAPTTKEKQTGRDPAASRKAKVKSAPKAALPEIPHAPPPARRKGTGSAFKFHNKDGVPDREPDLGPEPSKVRQTIKIRRLQTPEGTADETVQEAEDSSQVVSVQQKPKLRVPEDDKLIRVYFNDSPLFQRIPLALLKQAEELVLAFKEASLRKRSSNHQNPHFRSSDSADIVSYTNTAANPIELSSSESSESSEDDEVEERDREEQATDSRPPTKFFLALHTNRQKRERANNINNLFARSLDFYLDVPLKSFNMWQTWIEERAASSDDSAERHDMPWLHAADRRAYIQELVECYLGFARKWKLVDFANYLMDGLRRQSRALRGTRCAPFQVELLAEVWKETGTGDVLRSFVMYAVHEAFHPLEPRDLGKIFGDAWFNYAEIRLEYELGRELWGDDILSQFHAGVRDWEDDVFEERTGTYWYLAKTKQAEDQGAQNGIGAASARVRAAAAAVEVDQ